MSTVPYILKINVESFFCGHKVVTHWSTREHRSISNRNVNWPDLLNFNYKHAYLLPFCYSPIIDLTEPLLPPNN